MSMHASAVNISRQKHSDSFVWVQSLCTTLSGLQLDKTAGQDQTRGGSLAALTFLPMQAEHRGITMQQMQVGD